MMKKVNIISFIMGLGYFFMVQLYGNIYRISRLTGFELKTVILTVQWIIVILFIGVTIITFFYSRTNLLDEKYKYISVILWLPYFLLLNFTFTRIYPITNSGEMVSPAIGLLVIFLTLLFPLYVFIILFVSSIVPFRGQKKQ